MSVLYHQYFILFIVCVKIRNLFWWYPPSPSFFLKKCTYIIFCELSLYVYPLVPQCAFRFVTEKNCVLKCNRRWLICLVLSYIRHLIANTTSRLVAAKRTCQHPPTSQRRFLLEVTEVLKSLQECMKGQSVWYFASFWWPGHVVYEDAPLLQTWRGATPWRPRLRTKRRRYRAKWGRPTIASWNLWGWWSLP